MNPPRARDFSRPHLFLSDPLLRSTSVDSPKDSEDEDEADKRGFSRPRRFSPSAKVDTEKTNKREPSYKWRSQKTIGISMKKMERIHATFHILVYFFGG